MKKVISRTSLLASLLFVFVVVGCNFESVKTDFLSIFTQKGSIERNRSLSLDQVLQYKQLTSALITLDEKFIEELDKASIEDRQEILGNLTAARIELVKKYHFKDYEEYLWIDSVALKDPSNWAIAKTAGIDIINLK